VFLPALVASSLAKRLTLDVLADAWVLPVAAAAQIAVGAVAAVVLTRWVARPPPHLRRPFMCAVAFQNSSALPLVIGEALAAQPPFSHDPDAFGKLAIYIFLCV
jgi:predicted permease